MHHVGPAALLVLVLAACTDAEGVTGGYDAGRPGAAGAAGAGPAACAVTDATWIDANPIAGGIALRAVTRFDDGRVVAVGERGRVVVWRDGALDVVREDASQTLNAVWGSAPDDVWAVGDAGVVLHFDGLRWTRQDVPTASRLVAVWGRRGDVWIAGDDVVLRRDGAGSAFVEAGPGVAPYEAWTAIGGAAGGEDVWLTSANQIWRWSSRSWSQSAVFDDAVPFFTGIAALDGETAWAVGGSGQVLKWNGERWSEIARVAVPLRGLSVRDASSSVCAVGGARLLCWAATGDALHATPAWMPDPPVGGVDAVQPWSDGPVVVGRGGWLQRYDGAWRTLNDGATGSDLRAIWAPSADDVWVSTADGQLLRRHAASWQKLPLDRGYTVVALSGTSADSVWALAQSASGLTSLHWNGAAWTPRPLVASPSDDAPRRIVATTALDVWAVVGGELLHFDGRAWSTLSPGLAVNDVWASGRDDAWAAGDDGIAHWDGAQWTRFESPVASSTIESVWGDAPDDVWFGGTAWRPDGATNGVLARWDGSALAAISFAKPARGTLIAGAAGHVYLSDGRSVGEATTLAGFHAYPLHMDAGSLAGLAAVAPGDVFFAGKLGVLERRLRPAE